MPRTLILVKTHTEANALWADLPSALIMRSAFQRSVMEEFKAQSHGVLISCGRLLLAGYSFPENTRVLMGPGFSPEDYIQGYARARPGVNWIDSPGFNSTIQALNDDIDRLCKPYGLRKKAAHGSVLAERLIFEGDSHHIESFLGATKP